MSRVFVRMRLYPEPRRSLYARVLVWRRKRDMHAWLKQSDHWLGRCDGMCSAMKVQRYSRRARRWRTLGLFAEVNLWSGAIGSGVVAHELQHAALAWARRVRFDFKSVSDSGGSRCVSENEERLCDAVGRMHAQFNREGYRRRIFERAGWV